MTVGLAATLLLLALVDSLNPVTIAGAVFLLLTRDPVPRTVSFVAGACLAYLAGGVLLYFGLGAVFVEVLGYLGGPWVHGLLVVVGVALVGVGVWMHGSAPGGASGGRKIRSLHPGLTFLIGANVTASDLPTAFPLIAAVERMTSAGLGVPAALAALVLYVLVYALPLLVLVAGYLALRGRSTAFLEAAEGTMNRWSRPVTVWSLYAIGCLLVVNSGGYLVFGHALL